MADVCMTCLDQEEAFVYSPALRDNFISPCPSCQAEAFAEVEAKRMMNVRQKMVNNIQSSLGSYGHLSFDDIDVERPFEPIVIGNRRISVEYQKSAFKTAVDKLRDYAENPTGWLYVFGPRGGGKSALAACVANRAVERGCIVMYESAPQLLHFLRLGIDDSTMDDRIQQIIDCQLLVLDDLGAERLSEWADEQFFLILNERYQKLRPTLITSNFSLGALEEHYQDKADGMFRIVDRIREAKHILIPVSSYRAIKSE